MKFLLLLAVIAALVANCFALKNEVCGLPHSKGGDDGIICYGYIPSWTYNANANRCIEFIYGGCNGNKNRFHSQRECEKKCLEL